MWADPFGLVRLPNNKHKHQRPNAMRDHHTIPQEMLKDPDFVAQLSKCGIKKPKRFIDKQIVRINAKKHDRVHSDGWNNDWKLWFEKNPSFTKQDILNNIKKMMIRYNIPKSSRNYVKIYGKNGKTQFHIKNLPKNRLPK